MSCKICPYDSINKDLAMNEEYLSLWRVTFNDDNCNMKLLRQLDCNKSRAFLGCLSDVLMRGVRKYLEKKPCECISNLKKDNCFEAYTGCIDCKSKALVRIVVMSKRKNVITFGLEYTSIDSVDEQTQHLVDAFAKLHETSESQNSCHHADSSC